METHDPLCWMPADDHAGPCFGEIAKVRADERQRLVPDQLRGAELVRDAVLTNLRAKVEALPGPFTSGSEFILRSDVLALIDGGQPDAGVNNQRMSTSGRGYEAWVDGVEAVHRYVAQRVALGGFSPATERATRYMLLSWMRHVDDWANPTPDEIVSWVVVPNSRDGKHRRESCIRTFYKWAHDRRTQDPHHSRVG